VDLEEIDTSTVLFGRKLKVPLMVTAITGGFAKAETVNRNLAQACAELGLAMGVGSQRAALEKGERKSYDAIRDYDVPLLISNVGAPQLIPQAHKEAFGIEEARQAMDMIGAHILAVHLNYLQEVARTRGGHPREGLPGRDTRAG